MKALLKQTVILTLIVLASSHAHTPNAASAGDQSAILYAPQPFAQSSAPGQAKPLPAPARWRGLIGEYGLDDGILYILEKDWRLCVLFKRAAEREWRLSRAGFSGTHQTRSNDQARYPLRDHQ